MLESTMRRAGVDQVCQSKLVDVPETLERRRIDDLALVRADGDEVVNRITEFVRVLRHRGETMLTAAPSRIESSTRSGFRAGRAGLAYVAISTNLQSAFTSFICSGVRHATSSR